MELQPWQRYFDAFARQAGRIPADAFDRPALLYEAAHDAYQSTTNDLTAAGWDAERALMVGRLFGSTVKEWVDSGERDVATLESALRRQYHQWTDRK
ncbi:MAG TPA: hypothetical protein VF021_05940 [Longimicrobiales bacterium]